MTVGTGAARNIRSKAARLNRISRELELQRLKAVMDRELTELQRQTLTAYYFEGRTLLDIARQRNVAESTVSRTLNRAENKLRRFLQY